MSFNVALGGMALIVCLLAAVLVAMMRPPRASEDIGVATESSWQTRDKRVPADDREPKQRGDSPDSAKTRSTPLPEQFASAAVPLPATPAVASALDAAPARPTVEADLGAEAASGDSGMPVSPQSVDAATTDGIFEKAMAIYAARSAASAAAGQPAELPVSPGLSSSIGLPPPPDSPLLTTSEGKIEPGDSGSLRNLPKGYVIGKQGIRAVENTNLTPMPAPIEGADLSGSSSDFSSTRVVQLIRKRQTAGQALAVSTPGVAPPIAIPEEFKPRKGPAAATPDVKRRVHNIPTKLLQTPIPRIGSGLGETTGTGGLGLPLPWTDAGQGLAGSVYEDPRARSSRRLNEALAAASAPGGPDSSPVDDPRGRETRATSDHGKDAHATADREKDARATSDHEKDAHATVDRGQDAHATAVMQPAAVPTPITIRKGKAEVTLANVPPGWLHATPAGLSESAKDGITGSLPDSLRVSEPAASATELPPLQDEGAAGAKAAAAQNLLDRRAQARIPAGSLKDRKMLSAQTAPGAGAGPREGSAAPAVPSLGGGASTAESALSEALSTPLPRRDVAPGNLSDSQSAPATSPDAQSVPEKGSGPRAASLLQEKLREGSLPEDVSRKLSAAAGNQPQASVGSRVLSPRDVSRRVDAMLALRGKRKVDDETRRTLEFGIADDWAEKTAVAEEARRQGVTVTDDEVREFIQKQKQRAGGDPEKALRAAGFSAEEVMEDMRDAALCDKVIEQLFEKRFDDRKLRGVYDASPGQFQPSRRLHVMEIFKAKPPSAGQEKQTEQQMQQIRQQAAAGMDFAQLAQQHSEAPTRENGGDLGWIDAKTQISSEIAEALVNMRPGQVGQVVKSRDGYRILKLAEVQEPRSGYEGAKENVIAGVRTYLRRALYETAKQHVVVKVGNRTLKANAGGPDEQGLAGKSSVGAADRSRGAKPSGLDSPAQGGAEASPAGFGSTTADFAKPLPANAASPIDAGKRRQ